MNSTNNGLLAVTLAVVLHAGGEAQTVGEDGAAEAGPFRAPAEGGARRWRAAPGGGLRLFDAPSAEATVVRLVPEGAIFSNFGCADTAGQVWCEVRPFRGGERGFAPADRLLPAEGPDGIVPVGEDDSERRVRKRDFDAEGTVPCAQEVGQAMGVCRVGVARSGGGDATVVATFTNGFARRLYFAHGEFVSANPTMSGSGTDTDWRLENGRHLIRVDDQRYEIPDAWILGEKGE